MDAIVPATNQVDTLNRRMTTQKTHPQDFPGSLYCIVPYYNLLGLVSRYENFCVFYHRMMQQGANMLFADLALHDRALQLNQLVPKEQLPVQVCCNHILWQKENLLTRLLQELPDDCDKVCWVDSDILFQNDNWQAKICEELLYYRLVQGFSFAGMLPKGVEFIDDIDINSFPTGFNDCHKVYGYLCGIFHPQIKQDNGHPGFVWAARRELLEEIGFYNECVFGGADYLMARAALYRQYSPAICERYSRFQLASYFAWAQRCCEAVDMSVGVAHNIIYHLYHGSIRRRGHDSRLQTLRNVEYDPRRDLSMLDNGMWTVTDEGKRLLTPAREFFSNRGEDVT